MTHIHQISLKNLHYIKLYIFYILSFRFAPAYIEDNDINMKWLYEFIANEWKDWLPESAQQTLKNPWLLYRAA